MSEVAPRRGRVTLSDYETFVAPRPENERWELIGGLIEAMTNPGERHGLIVGNIFAPLKLALDKGGCRAFSGSMRVQRSDDRSEDMAAMPDILVRCGPRRDRNFATDPTVVVEVLSRSTMVRDRGVKFEFYLSLPTLQHIALVYQDQMRVEHYTRGPKGWMASVLTRPSDHLSFDAVDASVKLDTIYLDVPVLRPVETLEETNDEPRPSSNEGSSGCARHADPTAALPIATLDRVGVMHPAWMSAMVAALNTGTASMSDTALQHEVMTLAGCEAFVTTQSGDAEPPTPVR